jgi:hypothetical protein
MFEQLEKTIQDLRDDPREADTVKALRHQLTNMRSRLCRYGEYSGESFTGCKTCGGKIVICSNEKVVGKKRNSKGCNAAGCKYFEASTNGHKKTEKRLTESFRTK